MDGQAQPGCCAPRSPSHAYENWPSCPPFFMRDAEAIAPLSITGVLWYQGEQNSPPAFSTADSFRR